MEERISKQELMKMYKVNRSTIEEWRRRFGLPIIEISDLHGITAPNSHQISVPTSKDQFSVTSDGLLKDDIARADQMKIIATLQKCNGNVSKAAVQLGISRETVHNKIRKYAINTNEYRAR